MSDPSSKDLSLPLDAVAQRRAQRAALVKQIAGLQGELAVIEDWFAALSKIFPDALPAEADDADDGDSSSVWWQTIEPILAQAKVGLTPKDVADAIRNGGTAESRQRLIDNPNGHYNALGRAVSKGLIAKHGTRYYRNDLFNQMTEDDLRRSSHVEPVGIGGYALRLFKDHVRMTAGDVVRFVTADPEVGPTVNSTASIYTALSRLVKRNQLVREGDYYVLPQTNEPSGGDTPNGSDAGSDEGRRQVALRLV